MTPIRYLGSFLVVALIGRSAAGWATRRVVVASEHLGWSFATAGGTVGSIRVEPGPWLPWASCGGYDAQGDLRVLWVTHGALGALGWSVHVREVTLDVVPEGLKFGD